MMAVRAAYAQEPQDSLRYLALGDSYTIGESVPESKRWPVQLADALRQEGLRLAQPEIIAQTGWTTDELTAGIAKAHPQGPYALVSILIGVNNQYRGRSVEMFRREFRGLLAEAIAFADGQEERVFVVSIPDWGVMPFARDRDQDEIAKAIDAFNRAKKEEADHARVLFLDITPISRQAADDNSLVAPDGLHPSGAMYALWVQQIRSLVQELLTRQ